MPSFTSVDDFLQKLATLRGKLKKGGIVDVEAAAKIVLHDWNEGTIDKLFLTNIVSLLLSYYFHAISLFVIR
jgi:ribosome biogenesis GTPase A